MLGGSLEELGAPSNIQSAVKKGKQPQQLIQDITPPFASGVELDGATEQRDAPLPQPGVGDSDEGE